MQYDLLIRLKTETAACHARLENALDLMRGSWLRDDYIALLEGFYGYVAPWEDEAAACMPAHLRPFFDGRRKAALLASDIAFLTGDAPRLASLPAAQNLPALDTVAQLLGSMYVMEGSTLGGRFIASHVAKVFGFETGFGNAYFDGYGEHTGSMWNAFRDLASATVPPGQHDAAVAAAIETFDGLHAWLPDARAQAGAAA
jgi:heme oxygenase